MREKMEVAADEHQESLVKVEDNFQKEKVKSLTTPPKNCRAASQHVQLQHFYHSHLFCSRLKGENILVGETSSYITEAPCQIQN